jgi:putative aldouronate transport system substrate-binding protein
MKVKKLLALIMASTMAMSLLAGCGQKEVSKEISQAEQPQTSEQSQKPSDAAADDGKITFPLEEPIEITVYCCTGDSAFKLEDTAIFKHMEEMTNVKLKVTNVNLTENDEKRNVLLNSGDYPDVFIKGGMSPDELFEYGSEGIFVALDDYLRENAPNYCAIIDERDAWAEVTSIDGHIYSTYEISEANVGNTPHMWINQQWLDNLGLDMPSNSEQFYEVLKAFKEQDADGDGDPNNEIPWISSSDITPVEDILPYFGFNMQGWWDPYCVSEDSESIEFFPVTERYKEALAFITKCYDEGLLYKDSFSITTEQISAMGQTDGSIGVFCQWQPGGAVGYYDKTKSDEENKVLQYVAMVPWDGASCPTAGGLNRGGIAITDKCKYPEIMVAWADYLYSEEGARIVNYGIEGDTYDLVDGQVKMRNANNPSETWGENVDHALMQMGGGTFRPSKTYTELEYYVDLEEDPTGRILLDTYEKFEEMGKLYPAWPSLTLTEDEIAANAKINADTDSYRLTYRAEVITGKKDLDATWDEYIDTLNRMELQTAVNNMNAAYDRYKAN